MKNTSFILTAIALCICMSCKKPAGEAAQIGNASSVKSVQGTQYLVDLTKSTINWEGAKPTATHTGTINLTEGSVHVDGSKVTGGEFTIDMNSISDSDLEGEWKERLESHLKGTAEGKEDDFFNAPKYPTGKFAITKITILDKDPDASHLVYGNLTLRDITKEIGFKAKIEVENGNVTVSTPPFTIDRTQWGVTYGSKSVFDNLGDNFVNDNIGLRISLSASQPVM